MFYHYQVDSSYGAGDYQGALRNSNIAKWLNVSSIICGIVIFFIFAIVIFGS